MPGTDLQEREEAPATDNLGASTAATETPAAAELAALYPEANNPDNTPDNRNFVKNPLKPNGSKASKLLKKRGLLLAGGGFGGGLLLFAAVFGIIMMLFGSLQAVHFETVLRSAGFATLQQTMGKAYSQVLLDDALITDKSNGSLKLKKASPLATKRLKELGRSGSLKWDVAKNGSVRGLVIDGTEYSFDSYAKKSFGKTYDSLSTRQKWTVQASFSKDVKTPLNEVMGQKSFWYRSSVFNSLRRNLNISMYRWPNKAKELLGKNAKEATKINLEKSVQASTGKTPADLASKGGGAFDAEAEARLKEAQEISEAGGETRTVKPPAKAVEIASAAHKVSNVALVITIACIAHELDQALDQEEREQNSLRYGHTLASASDQIRSGDIVSEAAGVEGSTYNGAAKSYGYKVDTGVKISETEQKDASYVTPIFINSKMAAFFSSANEILDTVLSGPILKILANKIPALGEAKDNAKSVFCAAALNPAVQWTIALGEIGAAVLSAGFSYGAAEGVVALLKGAVNIFLGMKIGEALGRAVDDTVKESSNTAFSGVSTGADKYDEGKSSMLYWGAITNRTMAFGAPLSREESIKAQKTAMNDLRQENINKGVYNRYFATENPFSLFGSAVARMPTSVTASFSSFSGILQAIGSMFASPFRFLATALSSSASAADTLSTPTLAAEDVGVIDFGWTNEDNAIADSMVADAKLEQRDDETIIQALERLHSAQFAKMEETYMKCYSEPLQSKAPLGEKECSAESLHGYAVVQWRWYKAMKTAEAEGSKAIGEFTVNSGTPESPEGGTAPGECAAGSRKIPKTVKGYKSGVAFNLQLCAIEGMKSSSEESNKGSNFYVEGADGDALVSAESSSKFVALFNAAKKDGLTLTANSSFRTFEHQTSLCGAAGRPGCAKPGNSNHQSGNAIDYGGINCSYDYGNGSCPGDKTWQWLRANSEKYGLKQLDGEFWHFSPAGN